MSDQWGVPQQQPPYAPPPQYIDPAQQQQQHQQQQHQQSPPQQPAYAPQHGGHVPPQQPYPQPVHPQQPPYVQQQPHPQPPQYAPPAPIPQQQARYPQADVYARQVPPPAPVPHPRPNPVAGENPAAEMGNTVGMNADVPSAPTIPAAPAAPPAATAPPVPAGSAGSAGRGDSSGTGGDSSGKAGTTAPARSGNSFAAAGAVTSFVPVIGLVLSLAGLIRSRGRGTGKAAARVGVVLSLVFTAAWGAGGYYVYRSTNAKATDPGCVAADADFLGYSAQMQRDAADMAAAAGSDGGARSAAFTAAVRGYQTDVAKLVADFDADSAKAVDPTMKSAIEAVGADLTGLDTDFGNLATGNFAAATNLMDLNAKLMSDFQHMESVCTKAA